MGCINNCMADGTCSLYDGKQRQGCDENGVCVSENDPCPMDNCPDYESDGDACDMDCDNCENGGEK